MFDQLVERLLEVGSKAEIGKSATAHAQELRSRGFNIAQVVRDYGDICQVITSLAVEQGAPITPAEFQTLNLALDNAIAGAVTEYSRLHDYEGTERTSPCASHRAFQFTVSDGRRQVQIALRSAVLAEEFFDAVARSTQSQGSDQVRDELAALKKAAAAKVIAIPVAELFTVQIQALQEANTAKAAKKAKHDKAFARGRR